MLEQQPAHFVLATRLARLRQQIGLPIRAAAAAAGVSPTTIARIENGQVVPRRSTVETLLTQYGVLERRHRDHLLSLLSGERHAGWFDAAEIPVWLSTVLALEDQASQLMTYSPTILPPLLQTPAYARATMPGAQPAQVPGGVDVIRSRQRALEREGRPALWAVIDPRALLDPPLARPEDRLEQIDWLIAAAEQPYITIQIMRPASQTEFVPDAPRFTIVRLPDPERSDLLLLHLLHGPSLIDDPLVVENHQLALARLYSRAFMPSETVEILQQFRAVIARCDPFEALATRPAP